MNEINCDNQDQIIGAFNASINNHLVSIRKFLQSPTAPEYVVPQSIFNIEKPLPQLGMRQPNWFSMSSFSVSIYLPYEWFKTIVQQNIDNINSTFAETSMLNGLVDGGSGFGPDTYSNFSYSTPAYASNTFIFSYDPNQSYLRVNTSGLTEEQRVKAAYDLQVNPPEQIAKVVKYKPDIILIDLCNAFGNPLIWRSNVRMVNGELASRSEMLNRYPSIQLVEPLINEIHKNGIKCFVYWKPLFNFLNINDYPPVLNINGVISKYVRSTAFARSIFSENYKNFIKDLMCETVKPIAEGGLGVDGLHWDYSFMQDDFLDFSKGALDIWAKYLGYIDSEDSQYIEWAFSQANFPFPKPSLGINELKGDGSHLYPYGSQEGIALYDLINNDLGFITEVQKSNLINYTNVLKEKYNQILLELSLAVEAASYGNAVFMPSTEYHCYIERSDVGINFNVGKYGQAMKSEFAVEPRAYHRLRPRSAFYSPEEYDNPPCPVNPLGRPPVSVLAGTKEAEIVYADINRPDMASVINLAQKLDYCGGNKTSYTWKPTNMPQGLAVGSPGAQNTAYTFNTNQFRPYPNSFYFGTGFWGGDDSIIGYQRGAYQICLKNSQILDMTFLGSSGWGGDIPRKASIDYGEGYYNQFGQVSPNRNYGFFRKTAYHQKKIKEQMTASGLEFSKRSMYAWIGIHVSEKGRQGIGTKTEYLGDGNSNGQRYLRQCFGAPSGVGSNTGSSITYRTNSLGQNWGEFYWPIVGAMESLESKMIPYATISDEHVLNEEFSGLAVILIPHREWLSDIQLEKLQNFIDKGGKVLYMDEIFYSSSYNAGDPRLKGRFYDLEDRDAERAKLLNYILSQCGDAPLSGSVLNYEYDSSYHEKQIGWYKYSDISSDGSFTIGAHLLNDMSWMDLRKHMAQYGERFNELDPATVPYKSDTNPKLNGVMDYDLFGWGPNWRTDWYNTLQSDPFPSDNIEAPPIPAPDGNSNLAFYEPLPKNMWGKPLVGGYNGKYWSAQLRLKLPSNYKITKVCKIYVNQESEPLDFGVTKSSITQSLTHDPLNEISYYYDDSSKSWVVTVSKIGMHCLVGLKVQKQINFTPTCKKIFAYTSYPAYTSSEFDFDYSSNFLNTNLTRMHLISDLDLYGDFFDNSLEDKKYNFYSYNDGSYHADACFNHIKKMYDQSSFNFSYFDGHIGLEFSNLNQTIANAVLGSEDYQFTVCKGKIIDVIRDLKSIFPNAKIGIINFPHVPYSSINFSWSSLTQEAKVNLAFRSMSILEDVVKECDFISIPCLIGYSDLEEIYNKINYASVLSSSFRQYLYDKNIVCDIYANMAKEFLIWNYFLSNNQIDDIFNAFSNYVNGYFIYSNLRRTHFAAFIDADQANDFGQRERLQFILMPSSPINFNNSFNLINEYTQSFKNYLVGKINSDCNAATSGIINANKVLSIPHRGPKPPVWLRRSTKFIKATFSAIDIKNAYKSIVHQLPGNISPSPTGNCLYVSNYQSVNNFYYYEANQSCLGETNITKARTDFGIKIGYMRYLYGRAKYYLNEYPDGIVINAHDHDEPLWWNTGTPIGKWDILSNNVLHGMNVDCLAEAINIIKNISPSMAVLADINPCAFITLDESVYPFAINCFGLRVEKEKGGNDRCQFRSFLNQNMLNVISAYHVEAFSFGLDGILWNEPIISDFGDFEYSVRDRFAKYKGYVGADDPFFTELFPFPITCGTDFGNYVLKYFNPNLPINTCKGDKNNNGIIDNLDAISFNLAASNFSTNAEDVIAFDFDGDGVVTFDGDGPYFNAVLGNVCYDLRCDEIVVDHTLNIPTIKQLVCDLQVDGVVYNDNMRKMLIEYSNFCNLLAQNNILYISNMLDSIYGVGQKAFAPYVSNEIAYRFNDNSSHTMSINSNSINVDSGIYHQFYLNKRSSLSLDQNIAEIQRFSMSLGENLGLDILSGNHNKPVFVRMNPKIWEVSQDNFSNWSIYDSLNNTNIVEDGIVREDALRGYLTSNYFNYIASNFYPIIEMFSYSNWSEENYIPGNPPLPNVLQYSDIDRDPPKNNTPFLRNLLDIVKKLFSENFNSHLHGESSGYQKHAWIGIHHADEGRNALCLSNELSAFSEFYTKQFIDLSNFGYSGTLGWGDFYWPIAGSVEMCIENGIPHTLLNDFAISDGNFSGISVIIVPHKKLLSTEQLYKLSGFNGLVVYLDDLYGNYENIYNVWHSSVESNGILESTKAKNSLYNYIINYIGNPPIQLSLISDQAIITPTSSYSNKKFNVYEIVETNQTGRRRLDISISNDRSWADIRPNNSDTDSILSQSRSSDLINVNFSVSPFSSLYFNDQFYKDGSEIPVNGLFVWYSGYPPVGFGKKFVYKIALRGVERIRSAQAVVVDASTNSASYHNLIIQTSASEDVVFTPPISEFATISLLISENELPSSSSSTPASSSSSTPASSSSSTPASSSSSTPASSSSSSSRPSSSSSSTPASSSSSSSRPSSSSSRPSSSSSRPSSSSSSFVFPSSSSSSSSSSSVVTFSSSSEEEFTFPGSSSSSRPIGSSSSLSSSSTALSSSSSSYVTSPIAATYVLETDSVTNIEKEFGIEYYNTGFGGSVGDSVNIDFSRLQPLSIAKADSYTGIVTLYNGTRVGKYDVMSIEIKSESFRFAGVVGHDVLEDSFEGVSVGLSSSLGQVQNVNIIDQTINFNKFIYSNDSVFNYYRGYTAPGTPINNLMHTDFTSPDAFVDVANSDINYNLLVGAEEDNISIGVMQDVIYISDNKLLIVGFNGLAIFDSYNFILPDYRFQPGEILLNAVIWNNKIYLFTSNQILIFDYELEFISERNYNDYVGQVVFGYISDNGIFISTSNGFYVTKHDIDLFVRLFAPVIQTSNTIDIVAKYSTYNNIAIFLGNDIYWSSNLNEFGRIKTSVIGSKINGISKFFNRNIFACDSGLFISNVNMLANPQLQATLLNASIVEQESARFVDVVTVDLLVSENVVQSTVYAAREDGVVFVSQDPSNYFDKIKTNINKPAKIAIYGNDILVISAFNIYSFNQEKVYTLRRSVL